MVRIQKIVAKNFKSFAKTVEIPFDKGFNCIIGPNGAGKSNIADSMCFVLGKTSAKSMRAEKSSNLIYNGGKKGSPAKEAEVSIFFENDDKKFPIKGSNIKITRTVKSSGSSDYYINDEKRTRQQVVDLLRVADIDPDGHNVILQGDIVRFMELKSEERRQIIEDISGISVYEDKKQKSMNELEKVQEKLTEASIILSERKAYMDQLKKERDYAVRYRELEEDLKRNQATLLDLQIKKKGEQLSEVESKLSKSQNELDTANKNASNSKGSIEEKKAEIKKINEEIEKSGKVKQGELLVKIQSLKDGLVKDRSRLEVCESEIKRIEARKKQLIETSRDIENQVKEIESKKEKAEKERTKIRSELDEVNKEIQKLREKNKGSFDSDDTETEVERLQSEYLEKNNRYQEVGSLLERINFKIENLSSESDPEGLKRLGNVKKELDDAKSALISLIEEDSFLSKALRQHHETISDLNEKQARLRVRDVTIKEFSSVNNAVNQVKSQSGVFGTVAELGEVDSKYSLALQVAAGSRMNSVVVKDENVASRCIALLKQKKTGVLTFLPLNKIKSREEIPKNLEKETGVLDLAVNLIKFDPRFKNVFSYVFGTTLVVKDLNTAKKIGVGRARMVTLEGDLVEPSGAMIGGFRRINQGTGFKEKDVTSGLKEVTEKLRELQEQVKVLEKRKDKKEGEIQEMRERSAKLEGENIILSSKYKNQEKAISEISSLKKQEQQLSREHELLKADISEISRQLNDLKSKREKQRSKAPQALKMMEGIEAKKNGLLDRVSTVDGDFRSYEIQLKSILLPEQTNSQKITSQLDGELKSFGKEISELQKKLSNNQVDLKKSEEVQRGINKEFEGHFKRRDKLNTEIQGTEMQLVRFEERTKAVQERINSIVVDKARIFSEMEGYKKAFEEFTGVTLKRGLSFDVLKGNISDAQRELNKMGNVNLKALEAYEKIHEEYDSLVEKSEQLRIEKEDVLGLISEIDSKKTSSFMKTYKEISSRFEEIFSQLSRKSKAKFKLESEEKPLEGGIEISVKLAGSKPLDIRSLSGGEKTMAALAFIFAIQEYAPASFYLLDEVDAALDKENSELLSGLIAKYSDKAQYVVISHNDYIINQAKNIYGVSMQDGISKIVSLRV